MIGPLYINLSDTAKLTSPDKHCTAHWMVMHLDHDPDRVQQTACLDTVPELGHVSTAPEAPINIVVGGSKF
jgi:hypothetical protein